MEAITVVIIAVCGWIVTIFIAVLGWRATHLRTIKAQNKAFINEVVNDARLDVTKTIGEYQDWLGEVSNAICGVNVDILFQERGAPGDCVQNWLQKHTKFSNLFFKDRRCNEWEFRLIEHEILFPKTAGCLEDLGHRQGQITKYLSSFLDKLPTGLEKSPELEECKKAIEKVQNNLIDILTSQDALMWDLRSYLQNLCLSSLTGNKVPVRKPGLSPEVLAEDKRGNLRVFTSQNTIKVKDLEEHLNNS